MKFTKEELKEYEGKILKVRLQNGNFLRGRFMEFVPKDKEVSIVIQSNTYTFQINQKDIKEVEIIAEKMW